jgi:hypothetical protein
VSHLDVLDWIIVLLLALGPISLALAVAMLGVRSDRRRWADHGAEQRPGYLDTRPRW